MQIVIDIPEEVYKDIIDILLKDRKLVECNATTLLKMIKDGTVLPIGHGRLIDENDLIHENIECVDGYEYDVVHTPYIEDSPTIIEAERED